MGTVSSSSSSVTDSYIQFHKTASKLLNKALEISAYAIVVFWALGAALYDWGLNADSSFNASYACMGITATFFILKIAHEAFRPK